MGEKGDRLRNLRRKVFYRDGWQDQYGDWFAMCGYGCGTVVTFLTARGAKRDPDGLRTPDNTFLVCKTGCSPEKVAKARRKAEEKAAKKQQAVSA